MRGRRGRRSERARWLRAPVGTTGGDGGFGLVELLVAITLIAVGILAVGGGVLASMRLDRMASSRGALSVAAESKMEQLRAYARTGSADTVEVSTGGSLTASEENHADTVVSTDGGRIVRRWVVESGPSSTRTVTSQVEPLTDRPWAVDSVTVQTLVLIGE